MIFRINTNIASINAQRYLNQSSIAFNRSMERLSSGMRINRSADDATGLYISEGLRAELAGLRQASRNAGRAAAMIQTAEGGYDEIGGILNRLKELAVQAADGALSDENRTAIDAEADGLLAEIDRIADSTTYNDVSLITDNNTFTFQVGGGKDNSQISVTLSGAESADIGVDGIDLTTAANASDAIETLDTAIKTLNGYRDDIGAFQNRLERAISNINTMIENTMASDSVIRDADFAAEMAEMTRAQILIQAGTSMLGQANMMPQNALSLLP